MNYTLAELISRNQFEKVAKRQGYKNVHTMPYLELKAIANAAAKNAIANYWASKKHLPSSNVLADNGDAAAGKLEIPSHLYEENTVDVPCPQCDGARYVLALVGEREVACECNRCQGNGWVLDVEDEWILESEPHFPPFKVAA